MSPKLIKNQGIIRFFPGFDSLPAGKCIERKKRRPPCVWRETQCFDSLPAGKCLQRTGVDGATTGSIVSIPFQRESVSKEYSRNCPYESWTRGFHSLPPGKCLQRCPGGNTQWPSKIWFRFPSSGKVSPKSQKIYAQADITYISFDSLPAGKCLQSHIAQLDPRPIPAVSIPFQRESVSKGEHEPGIWFDACVFRFPSNGKVYPKQRKNYEFESWSIESFHSLPLGKCLQRLRDSPMEWAYRFQFRFPSNGKVSPKEECEGRQRGERGRVSIPFHWESVSKDNKLRKVKNVHFVRFHSLPLGKCLQRSVDDDGLFIEVELMFPFPSTGKVSPKATLSSALYSLLRVSIPFQRESVSKACISDIRLRIHMCFHSLPTGKHIQRFTQLVKWESLTH